MRVLARVSWGINPEIRLVVYKGLIRSHLEWASTLFAEASQVILKKLDVIQHGALRVVLGCMSTTSTPVLLSEAKERPLNFGRQFLMNRNAIRLSS